MSLDNLATPLRRKLTEMVGADDASVLLSNLSGEAEVASMGLVVGCGAATMRLNPNRREIETRQASSIPKNYPWRLT